MKGYDTNFESIDIDNCMRPCVFQPAMGFYDTPNIKGIFHRWVVIPHSYSPGGPLYGIVEVENGQIYVVLPGNIRFLDTDNYFKKYEELFRNEDMKGEQENG